MTSPGLTPARSSPADGTAPVPRGRIAPLIALAFVSLSPAAAGGKLFDSDGVLEIELRAPLATLYRERRQDERDEMPGTVVATSAIGETLTFDVGVRTRGNFRRRNCPLAPLRLRFDKKQVDGTLFDGERKLKLVSQCRGSARYERLIVSEYLAYKIFAELSEYHFRVRPLTVTFTDSERTSRPRSAFAFLIEDMDDMAGRYGRVVPDWERTEYGHLDPLQLAIVDVFQFMIGGFDWSVVAGQRGERCCHNSRLIAAEGERSGVLPVPYDFDLTGFVDAPYAFVPDSVPVKKVGERYFRGRCKSPELWRRTIALFRERRPAISALFDDESIVSPAVRKKSLRYLDGFYKILDDPKRVRRMLYDRCSPIAPAAVADGRSAR